MVKEKNIITRLGSVIKRHKVTSGIIIGCLAVCAIGVGLIAYNNARMAGTYKALEFADKGYLTEDELKAIEENGGLNYGEEIVDPNTGETYVLSKDENGNVVSTVVKDAQGNSTGAVVPSGDNGSGQPSGGDNSNPQPAHQHTWVAQYQTVHHDAVTQQVCVSPGGSCCNSCGAICTNASEIEEHTHQTGHGGWHSVAAKYQTQVISPAYDEQVLVGYVCSGCGTHQ